MPRAKSENRSALIDQWSDWIQWFLSESGLNQSDLASKLQRNRSQVSRWVNRQSLPDDGARIRLAELAKERGLA